MRTNRAPLSALALTTALLPGLAACGGGGDGGDGEGGEVVAESTAPPADPSGDWLSTSVTEAGRPRAMPPGVRVRLTFGEDGRLSAHAGCNTSSGSVSFADGRMSVGQLATTAMGCPGEGRAEQDQWLATLLGSSPAYSYAGDSLELTSGSTHVKLAPRAQVEPDLPVEGPRWRITHVTTGPPPGTDEAAAGAASGAGVSAGAAQGQLVFSGGKVTGSAGCARFSGPAEVGEASIVFGALEVDRGGCAAGGPGRMIEEALSVLAGTVLYEPGPRALLLTHASGRGLQLEAAQTASTARPTPAKARPGVGPTPP